MGKLILNSVLLVLILIIFSGVFVVSSRIVVKKALSWKLCLGYAFIALILSSGLRFVGNATWWPLPPLLNALFGVSVNLFLGTWIFGKFGRDAIGNHIGLRNGLKTTALGLAFILVFAALTSTVLYFLSL